MEKWENKNTDLLIQALLFCKNKTTMRAFLRDLLTEKELIEFGNRLKVAEMLSQKISYSKIEKTTGMSSTTIARISKWLNKGMKGYKTILPHLHHTSQNNQPMP